MRAIQRILIVALLIGLIAGALTARAAGLDDPRRYLGAWEGGEDYGETREYYLELLDYDAGIFDASLTIYRIWSFDGMTALLTEDAPSAVLATGEGDAYALLCALDFGDDAIDLFVLDSDAPDLPTGTQIRFERSDVE